MYLYGKMAGDEACSKVLKVSTSCVSKCKIKYSNKYKRNRNRNLRRKKRKLRHIENIRNLGVENRSQELCSTLSVFNIADMNNTEDHSLKPPQGVAEWQYQHQLAYWKSRAISLEYENRMLHAHIKNMCTQEIQNYVDYVKNPIDSKCIEDDDIKPSSECESATNSVKISDAEENDTRIDMKMLYGEMESKISAMETAMKVNYKMQVDRYKPQMWPNIPFNL